MVGDRAGDKPVLENPNPGDRPVLGISIGDPAGIGPEITLKALARSEIYEKAVPVVYADRLVLEDGLKVTGKELSLRPVKEPGEALGRPETIDFIEAGVIMQSGDYAYGKTGAKSGDAAFQYVARAINDAQAGAVDAVVTCPINKEAINLAGHHFAGHTEIFAHYTNTKNYGMLLSARNGAGSLNVIHVTTHVSLRRACDLITKDRVLDTIRLADIALTLMGGKTRRIAVAGLNPHSSENGLFGYEENTEIIPAIEEAKAEGLDASGPYPPDTVFVKALGGAFDIVVAMYHDQGHIPLKLCGFTVKKVAATFSVTGVNATIGLPVIRTSVDHGTAFDIAGKNQAGEDSLLDAIDMAITFCINRAPVKP
ncbi:MAG: 4-hydroxythreonine-4-phosphate dehydrogenase PdxA [Treponema sp.]|jgi:4-hydroxythreonine-4-phosphate dehydrogenase|nr:4-hydroxythreonine-4-phosphate dehydrogenase PdxA [Treponema sp.]